jgi:methylenetetrahydrofolate reductase (NADPH)
MRISEAYQPDRIALSFELFPPKTEASEAELFVQVRDLVAFEPSLITCTYGAGGSTQTKTLDIIERVRREFNVPVASHLTCVGSTIDDLRRYLTEAWQRGVTNIVALRGDPPKGETQFKAVAGGLRYANELVTLIRNEFPQFGIAVAGYPEKHIEAPSLDVDLVNLQRKVAAGADIVVTQLFYDNADFFRFRERCEQLAIQCPIVPGVLPVTNLAQIKRITSLCAAKLPTDLVAALEACGESLEDQFRVGVEFATRQVQDLIDAGVPGVHFYVLNKSAATSQVLHGIKLPDRVKKKWVVPAPHSRSRSTAEARS